MAKIGWYEEKTAINKQPLSNFEAQISFSLSNSRLNPKMHRKKRELDTGEVEINYCMHVLYATSSLFKLEDEKNSA